MCMAQSFPMVPMGCRDKQRDEAIANGTFVSQEVSGPSKDYSLKEGQKISIKLPVRFRRYQAVPCSETDIELSSACLPLLPFFCFT